MTWERLSVRSGHAPAEALVEGVPGYLKYPLTHWLRAKFGWYRKGAHGGVDHELLQQLATVTRIQVLYATEIGGISAQITGAIQADQDLFLDVLDATLHLRGRAADAKGLRDILELEPPPGRFRPTEWLCRRGLQRARASRTRLQSPWTTLCRQN